MAEKGNKISYRRPEPSAMVAGECLRRPMLRSTVCNILCIYSVGMYDIHGLQPDQDIQDIQYN